MDANLPGPTHSIHVHNYSLVAVQSFILEVKKFPIIYSGNTRVPYPKGLIEFAWARIVAALLDESVNFDVQQRGYWNRSFRELWKWMQLALLKDMFSRRNNPIYIRHPEYSWLMHLKFLEPYVQMNGNAVIDSGNSTDLDPDIQIKVETSEIIIDTQNNDHTIIWLRDSTEPEGTESLHISILLRVPVGFSTNLHQRTSGLGVFSQVSQCVNNQPLTEYQQDSVGALDQHAPCPCPSGSNQNQQWGVSSREALQSITQNPVGILDQYVPCAFTFNQNQQVIGANASNQTFDCQIPCSSVNSQYQEVIVPFPQAFKQTGSSQYSMVPLPEVSSQAFIDEDLQYIMSLLPKLKELEQKKNAEVKMLMIQALQEAL